MSIAEVTPVSTAALAPPAYYPLSLFYANQNGRKWKLDFQLRPGPRVIFEGDFPTQAEIVEALAFSNYPVSMVQVVQCVLHAVAPRTCETCVHQAPTLDQEPCIECLRFTSQTLSLAGGQLKRWAPK
jgi:hypothetical protein